MTPAEFPARRTLAWLAAGAVLLVLAGIALHLAGLDPVWLLRAHASARSQAGTVLWSCLTVLGLGWCALICVLAADRGAGRLAALLLPTFIVGTLLTHVTKWVVAVPRPAGTDLLPRMHVIGQVLRGSVSMPSGHSITAAAMAALLFLAVRRARAALLGPLLALGAVSVATSRVMVGAHWPSDVTVGLGLGLLSVALCGAAIRTDAGRRLHEAFARRIASPAGQRWLAVVEVAAAVGLLRERTGYPAGEPMVIAMVVLACASAIRRWRAAREARPVPALAQAPVERT